jgi:hypothetical protein
MMVGYYAYKDKLDDMKFMMKIVIFINIAVAAAIILLADKKSFTYLSSESKSDFLIGVLIMLIPKVFIFFYCTNKISYVESNIDLPDSNWEIAALELSENKLHSATWAKSYAMSEGDDAKTKALYLKLRTQNLSAESSSAARTKHNNNSLLTTFQGAVQGFKDGMNDASKTGKAEYIDLNSVNKPQYSSSIGSNVFMIFFGLIWLVFGVFMLQEKNITFGASVGLYLLILFGGVITAIYSFITIMAMRERGWQYWIDVLKGLAFIVVIGVGIASLYDYFN